MSNHTITKEQAYHAYTVYQTAEGHTICAFDSFSDEQFAAWQAVGAVFYSFWAVPAQSCAAA